MFNDDQFNRYVNVRFPTISDSQRLKTKEVARPTAPLVIVVSVELHSEKSTISATQTVPPLSEAA